MIKRLKAKIKRKFRELKQRRDEKFIDNIDFGDSLMSAPRQFKKFDVQKGYGGR